MHYRLGKGQYHACQRDLILEESHLAIPAISKLSYPVSSTITRTLVT